MNVCNKNDLMDYNTEYSLNDFITNNENRNTIVLNIL